MNSHACSLALLTAVCLAIPAQAVAQSTSGQPVYDQYEPSKVRRSRLQECLRDEEPSGAYCVKLCQKGYQPVAKSDPPRCRSNEPLPPGQIAGAIRKETGVQAKPEGFKSRSLSGGEK